MSTLESQLGGRQQVIGGPFGSKLTQKDYTEEGIPVIRGSNMVGPGRWLGGEFAYVSERKVKADLTSNVAHPGDIIVTQRGTLGQVAIVPEHDGVGRYVISQSQMAVRVPNQKANRDFVYYFLQSPYFASYVETSTIQTGVPHINLGILRSAPAIWPERNEQRQIASVLVALDDKIELNRRMNHTFEEIARVVFNDWFVDFGPTRAKIEGRAPYLAAELWELFPNTLDDEDTPVGWRWEGIGDHVVARKGLNYKGASLTDDSLGLPLHNLNSILEGGGYKHDGLKFYSGAYKPRHIIRPGDLIVANTEQGFDHLLIGYSALVPTWVGNEGLFSHHIFRITPRPASPLSRVWLHYALSATSFGETIRRFSNGTTVNMLPADAFEIPNIVVPPLALVRKFDEFVWPMLRQQEDAVCESRTLGHTRDFLLPKLMSGEVCLREAEKAVEAVA